MRVGVLGGTFDPVHNGHVETVEFARRHLALDQVMFVPTAVPPHKATEGMASAWRRYVMVELALLDLDWAQASPRELRLDQPSYTIDTMESLAESRPEVEWVLLIGGDSLAQLTTWRRWQDLLRFEIGVLCRPCVGCPEPGSIPEPVSAAGENRIRWVANPLNTLSSTRIRSQIELGEFPHGLHPRVLEYASKYNLYR